MVQAWPHRISWARLPKRVFDIDTQRCPNFGDGELKFIAAILGRPAIEKILSHLGLDPQPPSPDTSSPVDGLCLARGRARDRASGARRVGLSLEASCLAVDGWARPARPRIRRRCRVHPGACRLEGGVWISYAPEFAMPEVLVRLAPSQDRMFNY